MSNQSPQAVYDQMMQHDYFSQWMNLQLISIGEGSCSLSMKVRKEMLNGFGIVHGGILFSMADSAFAFASNSHGRLSVSIEASLHLHKSSKEGEILKATATERHLGNKTATYDILIQNEQQEDVALFRGIVYRTSKPIIS